MAGNGMGVSDDGTAQLWTFSYNLSLDPATLVGKVYVQDYNGAGQLVDEYYAPDERVFIIYGQDTVYGDEMRTHFDGTFRFQHLYKGDYRVFAYSECDTCSAPEVPVMVSATFTKNQETITTADIVIRK